MALTRVQSTTNQTINQGSVPLTFAASPVVGHGVVVAVVSGNVTGVTDNCGNTYQIAKVQAGGSGNVSIWFCPAITATATPFIVTPAGATFNHRLGVAIEANVPIAVDQSFGKDAGSAPSLTPSTGSTPALTVSEALIVTGIAEGNNQTTITVESVSPIWNQDGEILNVVYGEIDSRVVTNNSAQSCSWTVSPNSAGYWTVIVAFKSTIPAPTGSAYADKVIADGASLYLRLDEASGNVVSKVGGYTGTISGGVTLNQPGALADGNTAMAFDGSTGKVAIPTGAYSALGAGNGSLELWCKSLTIPSGSSQFVSGTLYSGTDPGFAIEVLANGSIQGSACNGTATPAAIASGSFAGDGQWHHVVVVCDRADFLRLYVDGVLKSAVTNISGGTLTATNPLAVGTFPIGVPAARYFNGLIDEVAIYPTALSAAQISQHYNLRNAIDFSNSPTELITTGTSTNMSILRIYALPARVCYVNSRDPIEYSFTMSGPWAAFNNGIASGGFVRCPSADTTIICKTKARR